MTDEKWRQMSHPEKLVWANIVALKLTTGESAKEAVAAADKWTAAVAVELGLEAIR